MADLSEFLGNLVSSISESRVNSDLQTIRIAKQYASDNLLEHFAVPRMRIENVELTIPVAVDETNSKDIIKTIEPIDNVKFYSITYQQILKEMAVNRLPEEISKEFKTKINNYIKLLEAQINVNQIENSLYSYCKKIAEISIENLPNIYKLLKIKPIPFDKMAVVQNNIIINLQADLKNEIKITETKPNSSMLNVIVESSKLREIKPENIILIKMKVSEQGMEWIKMENDKGEIVSKLMPE
jgi:hypothetical protein